MSSPFPGLDAYFEVAFVGQCINQRRRYPATLRQVFARHLTPRQDVSS